MVLVTGAGGQVGCEVIRALHTKGVAARAFIHSEANAEKVLTLGADEVFVGDMTRKDDLRRAVRGVDGVYFISPAAHPGEDEIGELLIQVAKEAGDVYFVYHSVMHSVLTDMRHHEKKLRVERLLVDSGLEYTVLQPAVFMQMLLPAIGSVKKGGPLVQKFYAEGGHTRMSFVDMRDLAEAVAEVFTGKDYVYGTYELCGGGTYSLADVERVFSDAAGRKVASHFITDDEFLANAHLAPSSYQAETLLAMFRHYNTHSFCGNSKVLAHILKREPTSLPLFVQHMFQEPATTLHKK